MSEGAGSHSSSMPCPPSVRQLPAYRYVFFGLGTLLIVAAALKTHQLATTPTPPGAFVPRGLMIVLVHAEFLLGVCLLFDIQPYWLWRVSLMTFGCFATITLYKALAGETSCGCFGRVAVPPWWTVVIDGVAVCLLLRFPPKSEAHHFHRLSQALALFLLLSIPGAVAIAQFNPQSLGPGMQPIQGGDLVLLEPESWLAQEFPLIPFIENGEQLQQGTWKVVLVHHDCPRCQSLLPDYQQRATAGESIALIELPPFGKAGLVAESCWQSRISSDYEWFVTTPVEILLEEGLVRHVEADPDHTESIAAVD